jgi:hypothetical protein
MVALNYFTFAAYFNGFVYSLDNGGVGTAAPVINAPTNKSGKKYIPFGRQKALLCVLGIPSPKLISPSQSICFWTSKSCAMRRLHQHIPQTKNKVSVGLFFLLCHHLLFVFFQSLK